MALCDFCLQEGTLLLWKRVAPTYDDAGACEACTGRLIREAGDRSFAAGDYYRVLGTFLRAGGEVWTYNGMAFWYPSPPLGRTATSAAAPLAERPRKGTVLL